MSLLEDPVVRLESRGSVICIPLCLPGQRSVLEADEWFQHIEDAH